MRSFRRGGNVFAAAVSWASGLAFYGFWAVAASGAAAFFASSDNNARYPNALPGSLLFLFFYWQVTPVITASMGASLDLKKLLVYPVPHRSLFLVELLLRVTTCLEMILLLAGILIGLALNPATGGLLRLPRLLVAALLIAALNILCSAALRNAIERLMRRKRVKEALMFLLVAITVLPQFLLSERFRPRNLSAFAVPDATVLPWGAAARLMLGTSVLTPLIVLLFANALAYALARAQFESSLRFDGSSAKAERSSGTLHAGRWEPFFRWPALLFPDPIAAIVEKELRSLLRTPQFRYILLVGSAFGLVLYLPRMFVTGTRPDSFLSGNILAFASIYSVLMIGQVSYFNCFGYDRSAAQAWFCYPVSFTRTLVAKNVAALSFVLVEVVLVHAVALLLRFPVTPLKALESLVVSLISALYLFSFGNLASVRMPHALDPERISQGGRSRSRNALMVFVFPVVLLPVVLAYWGRAVFASEAVFFGLLLLAAVLGAVLYAVSFSSSLEAARTRREKIVSELSRGEGPLSLA